MSIRRYVAALLFLTASFVSFVQHPGPSALLMMAGSILLLNKEASSYGRR